MNISVVKLFGVLIWYLWLPIQAALLTKGGRFWFLGSTTAWPLWQKMRRSCMRRSTSTWMSTAKMWELCSCCMTLRQKQYLCHITHWWKCCVLFWITYTYLNLFIFSAVGANPHAPLEIPIFITSRYWGGFLWSRGQDGYPPQGHRQVFHPPCARHGPQRCGEAGKHWWLTLMAYKILNQSSFYIKKATM